MRRVVRHSCGYCVYCDEKVVALICNNELFVKVTAAGEAFLGEHEKRPAYPGAKPSLYISGDRWDDADWIAQLIQVSAAELSKPKPQKRRKRKNSCISLI